MAEGACAAMRRPPLPHPCVKRQGSAHLHALMRRQGPSGVPQELAPGLRERACVVRSQALTAAGACAVTPRCTGTEQARQVALTLQPLAAQACALSGRPSPCHLVRAARQGPAGAAAPGQPARQGRAAPALWDMW